MAKVLSEAAVADYQRNGCLFPVDVLSTSEATSLAERYAREEASITGKGNENPHLRVRWLADIVRHPRILDTLEDLIGPDIFSFSSRFFTKPPATGNFVSWHQDATYAGLTGPDMITVWLAFTPSTLLSGCVQFLPGSQAAPIAHRDTYGVANMLTRGQEIAVTVDEKKTVVAELAPGQISVHHPLIVHGSGRNRSEMPRVGFGMQFVPAWAKPRPNFEGVVALVRGEDRYSHFPNLADWDRFF